MPNPTSTTKFDFIETDRRILDQRLRRHQITQTEYQRLLKQLSDDQGSSEELSVFKAEAEKEATPAY